MYGHYDMYTSLQKMILSDSQKLQLSAVHNGVELITLLSLFLLESRRKMKFS